MAENKNDNRNPKSDLPSHLEKTQEGKKKEEINPNNPTAKQGNPLKADPETQIEDKDQQEEESTSNKSENKSNNKARI